MAHLGVAATPHETDRVLGLTCVRGHTEVREHIREGSSGSRSLVSEIFNGVCALSMSKVVRVCTGRDIEDRLGRKIFGSFGEPGAA